MSRGSAAEMIEGRLFFGSVGSGTSGLPGVITGPGRIQIGDGSTPGTASVTGQMITPDPGQGFQPGMDDPAKGSGPLSVDDTHRQDPFFAASPKIFGYEIVYVGRWEDVQVQHPIDRVFYFTVVVHRLIFIHRNDRLRSNEFSGKGVFRIYGQQGPYPPQACKCVTFCVTGVKPLKL